MVDHIEVDAFVKVLGDDTGGMSKPVHVIGSDGKEYLLKNQNVYNESSKDWEYWDCMFLQEVLVYRIAKYLEITVPECAIASVDQIFIDQAPSLRFTHRYVPGYHFASNVIEGVENNLMSGYLNLMSAGKKYMKRPWNNFFNNIANKEDVAKIIVLDLLTANFDRFGNTGNLLIASTDGTRKVYCIDHGHCFYGPAWRNIHKQDMMRSVNEPHYINAWANALVQNSGHSVPMSGLGEVFRALDQFIDVSDPDNHCFYSVVHLVENITSEQIDLWFEGMPSEWFIDRNEQMAYYKFFILNNKNRIRQYISIMASQGAFHSYLGGEFQWSEKPTGTQ
ncbi:hypothetical protein [Paenibacillus amylolyticus]|uniref:hypothetical protein n=1 Tax=Paenibacillus amylolyticus TaxID=1451 RepID=UPI000FDB739D|nr:hypothetical protein [Paenibacillus amylolyticus]